MSAELRAQGSERKVRPHDCKTARLHDCMTARPKDKKQKLKDSNRP